MVKSCVVTVGFLLTMSACLVGILFLVLCVYGAFTVSSPAMKTPAERYQVADVFPMEGYLRIVQAPPESKVYEVSAKLIKDMQILYDATSDTTMWRQGNNLHLFKGYRIGGSP